MLGGMAGGGEGAADLPDQLLGKVEGMLDVVRKVRGPEGEGEGEGVTFMM